jgi:hypothetical protein
MSIDGQRAGSAQHRVSPLATGLAVFAGALMIVSGIAAVFEGIAAVFNDKVFASNPAVPLRVRPDRLGWIHLFLVCWSDLRVSRSSAGRRAADSSGPRSWG